MYAWFYHESTNEPLTACILSPEFQLLAPGDVVVIEDFKTKRPGKPCESYMVEVVRITYDRIFDPVGLSFMVRIL